MRTVLISGANRGLGLEFAKQYLAAGERVIAGVRDPNGAKELMALPGQERLSVHALDVGDEASVKAFRSAVGEEPIDILIANAGVFGGERQRELADLDFDAWRKAFNINSLGPVRLAAAFIDRVAAGKSRKMIAVSSLLGSTSDSSGGQLAYRASKAALNNAWRNIALELKDQRIVCIVVHPGWVRTDMGGPQAPLDAPRSVAGLRENIDRWGFEDTGRFLSWEGKELPW